MTKSSVRKFSILGFVLIAASAVTAAIVPSKTKDDSTGKLVASTGGFGGQKSCVATAHAAGCNVTAGTATSDAANGKHTSANAGSSAGLHSSQSPE